MVVLAFGWQSSDQKKWNATFGPPTGCAAFGSFCDLQVASRLPGLHTVAGLARWHWPCSEQGPGAAEGRGQGGGWRGKWWK